MRETASNEPRKWGGADPTVVMNVGGGDGGAWLTVAEWVTLRKVCAGEIINERRDDDGGVRKLPPEMKSETERDCETSAYCGTYYVETKTANVST